MIAQQQSVRSYPRPFGINLAHVLGYLSPITSDEYDVATEAGDASLNGASVVGRAGVEQEYDRWLRGMPGYRTVAVDSMGRVLGDDGEVAGQPGDTLVTSIDAKVQGIVERQLADTIKLARATHDDVTGRNYAADSGAVVVMEADTGRVVAMASQPTYDPSVWVGGVSKKQLERAVLRAGRQPAARPGDAGPVRAGLDLEAVQRGERPQQRLHPRQPARLLVGRAGRQPVVQELRVRVLRLHRLRQGAADLVRLVLLPRRPQLLAALRHGPAGRRRQGPAGRGSQEVRLRQARPGSTCRGSPAAGSPTGTGSWRTGSR